jgi:hypothetical protein
MPEPYAQQPLAGPATSARPAGQAGQPIRALFQQRVDGDSALLRLAQLRFAQAGLAAEVYAGNGDQLERVLRYAPAGQVLPMVHLDRGLNVLRESDRAAVAALATRFAGRVAGLVVHDKAEMFSRIDDVVAAMRELSAAIAAGTAPSADRVPVLLEYATGAELDAFVALGHRLRDIEHIGLCVDIGHVGIRHARRTFALSHAEPDLAALTSADPRLPDLVADVQAAVGSALPALLELLRALPESGPPLHLHLHDGHPLVAGLADHYTFLSRLPIPFEHDGRRSLDPLYGPAGLAAVVRTLATRAGGASLSLEIHQAEGRLPLADAAGLFQHWQDTTNAERMNYWLSVLAENAVLLTAALDGGPVSPA